MLLHKGPSLKQVYHLLICSPRSVYYTACPNQKFEPQYQIWNLCGATDYEAARGKVRNVADIARMSPSFMKHASNDRVCMLFTILLQTIDSRVDRRWSGNFFLLSPLCIAVLFADEITTFAMLLQNLSHKLNLQVNKMIRFMPDLHSQIETIHKTMSAAKALKNAAILQNLTELALVLPIAPR